MQVVMLMLLLVLGFAPAAGHAAGADPLPRRPQPWLAGGLVLALFRTRLAFPFVTLRQREPQPQPQPEAAGSGAAPVVLDLAPGVRCTVVFAHGTARRLLEVEDAVLARALGSERPLPPLDLDRGPGLDPASVVARTREECMALLAGCARPSSPPQPLAAPASAVEPEPPIRGRLLAHGETGRFLRGRVVPGCYYVDVAEDSGAERRVWGNDLKERMRRAGPLPGARLELRPAGVRRVRVSEPGADGSTRMREVNKRLWEVRVLDQPE